MSHRVTAGTGKIRTADRAEQVVLSYSARSSLPTRLGPALLSDREELWGERAGPRCAQGNLRGQRQRIVKMPRLDGELRVTNFPDDPPHPGRRCAAPRLSSLGCGAL